MPSTKRLRAQVGKSECNWNRKVLFISEKHDSRVGLFFIYFHCLLIARVATSLYLDFVIWFPVCSGSIFLACFFFTARRNILRAKGKLLQLSSPKFKLKCAITGNNNIHFFCAVTARLLTYNDALPCLCVSSSIAFIISLIFSLVNLRDWYDQSLIIFVKQCLFSLVISTRIKQVFC